MRSVLTMNFCSIGKKLSQEYKVLDEDHIKVCSFHVHIIMLLWQQREKLFFMSTLAMSFHLLQISPQTETALKTSNFEHCGGCIDI